MNIVPRKIESCDTWQICKTGIHGLKNEFDPEENSGHDLTSTSKHGRGHGHGWGGSGGRGRGMYQHKTDQPP